MVDLNRESFEFADLLEIMRLLRSPTGCPWDIEQTHESIRKNFIEEVYEACEAIDKNDAENLCEELGDVLLQVVFHAQISQENGDFSISEVCDGICRKLISRHPHIFAGESADTPEEVLKKWDDIKKREKSHSGFSDGLESVAMAMPSMLYAEKLQSKARKCGFDWDKPQQALEKVAEETQEVETALETGVNVEEEIGDLLFAAVNVSRLSGIDPERALKNASLKFLRRFKAMEELSPQPLDTLSLTEMDKLWEQVKGN